MSLPYYADPAADNFPASGQIHLWQNQGYTGGDAFITISSAAEGGYNDFGGRLAGGASSLTCDLPQGVVVLLFERPASRQNETNSILPIWGKMGVTRMRQQNFDDKLHGWSWFQIV